MEEEQQFASRRRRFQSSKITKYLLERQRRARMNQSLHELKTLVLSEIRQQNPYVDSSACDKMEKAQILELAVDYVKTLNCRQDHFGRIIGSSIYSGSINYTMLTATEHLRKDQPLSQIAECSCVNANCGSYVRSFDGMVTRNAMSFDVPATLSSNESTEHVSDEGKTQETSGSNVEHTSNKVWRPW